MNPNGFSPFFGGRGPLHGGGFADGPFRDGGGAHPLDWVLLALLLVTLLSSLATFAVAYAGRAPARQGLPPRFRFRRSRPEPAAAAATGPLGDLDARYARGEIGRDEYLQTRADLGGPPPAPHAAPAPAP